MAAPKHSDTPKTPDLKQRAASLPGDLARTKGRRSSPPSTPEPEAPGDTGEVSLSDFAAVLSPLLDEAEERWAHVRALFEQAERA